jgi:hypothetical protein
MAMDFDRMQQVLEALQAQCPHTDPHGIDIWSCAITRAREALLGQQIKEDRAAGTTVRSRVSAGTRGSLRIVQRSKAAAPGTPLAASHAYDGIAD